MKSGAKKENFNEFSLPSSKSGNGVVDAISSYHFAVGLCRDFRNGSRPSAPTNEKRKNISQVVRPSEKKPEQKPSANSSPSSCEAPGTTVKKSANAPKVNKFANMKELAAITPYLIPLAETTDLIKNKNIQVREYRKLVEDRDSIINKLQRDNDETRILAAEKPIIGEEVLPPPDPPGHPWIWFAGFIFATLIGYKLPESIAVLRDMNQDLSALLVALVVGAAYMLTHRQTQNAIPTMVET